MTVSNRGSGLLGFYILATSKGISGRVLICDSQQSWQWIVRVLHSSNISGQVTTYDSAQSLLVRVFHSSNISGHIKVGSNV